MTSIQRACLRSAFCLLAIMAIGACGDTNDGTSNDEPRFDGGSLYWVDGSDVTATGIDASAMHSDLGQDSNHQDAGAMCIDGQKNGGETDTDCGGPCTKCGPDKQCLVAADCLSGTCDPTLKTCVAGAPGLDCLGPDDFTISNGTSKTYYQNAAATDCSTVQQARLCTNGSLSGSYEFPACTDSLADCVGPNSSAIPNGTTKTYYQTDTATDCGAIAEARTCSDGTLSGSYTSATCTGYLVSPQSIDLGIHQNATPTQNVTIQNTGVTPISVSVTAECTYGGHLMTQVGAGQSFGATTTVSVDVGQSRSINVRTNPDGYPKFFGQDHDARKSNCYLRVSGPGYNKTLQMRGGLMTVGYTRLIRNLYVQFANREPDVEGYDYWYHEISKHTRQSFVSAFYNAMPASCSAVPWCLPEHTDCLTEMNHIHWAFYEKTPDPYWHDDCATGALANLDFHGRADVLGSAGGDSYWTSTWGDAWK